jgi:hypothetical protein
LVLFVRVCIRTLLYGSPKQRKPFHKIFTTTPTPDDIDKVNIKNMESLLDGRVGQTFLHQKPTKPTLTTSLSLVPDVGVSSTLSEDERMHDSGFLLVPGQFENRDDKSAWKNEARDDRGGGGVSSDRNIREGNLENCDMGCHPPLIPNPSDNVFFGSWFGRDYDDALSMESASIEERAPPEESPTKRVSVRKESISSPCCASHLIVSCLVSLTV